MSDGTEIRGALPVGTVLQDRYTIEKRLGRGGFAITYLCRSGEYGKASAIKEFMPASLAHREADGTVHPLTPEDVDFFERGLADFIEEGRRLVQCRHPNVVQVEDHFEEHGTAYLVMEFIEGETLYDHLLNNEPLDVGAIAEMMQPVLDALSTVHAQGLLHRDLTPNNIILRDKDISQPVLIDFGAARHANGLRSATIAQICSDGYSPPEQYQAREEQTPALDIHAIGCISYRCLTGKRPPRSIDRYSRDVVAGWGEQFMGSPAGLIVPAIAKSIDLEPANRQQSAEEFKADFAGVAQALAILGGLDGEAGKADQKSDGLYWTVRSDGAVELSGTLQSAAQYEQLQSALSSAMPALNVVDQAELKTARIPKGIALQVTFPEAPTKPVAENATTPIKNPTGERPPGSSAENRTTGRGDWPRSDPPDSGAPQRSKGMLAIGKIAAVIIGLATIAGGVYLVAQPVQTRPDPGPTATTKNNLSTNAPDNPFNVSIQLPKTNFKIGDELTFTIKASRRCAFSIHTIATDGTHEIHDPREQKVFMGSRYLEVDESRTIPMPGAPGKAIIKEPKGEHQIFAVCGRKDHAEIGLINDRLRQAQKSSRRSFKFVFDEELEGIDRDLLAKASVTYIVE